MESTIKTKKKIISPLLLRCKLLIYFFSGKILHIDFGDCFEASMNREKFPEKVSNLFFTKEIAFYCFILTLWVVIFMHKLLHGFMF